jgi:hypothetical protein
MKDSTITKLDILREAMTIVYGQEADLSLLEDTQITRLWESYRPILSPEVDKALTIAFREVHNDDIPNWVQPFYDELNVEIQQIKRVSDEIQIEFRDELKNALAEASTEANITQEGSSSSSSPEM